MGDQACQTCDGRGVLINRDGVGLVPLADGESNVITASPVDGFPGCYVAKSGEVAPCPNCVGER